MKIKLTEKYRPFSHEVGTSVLLPGSGWKMVACPARIELENIIAAKEGQTHTIVPHIVGPLSAFTMMQDLERRWVRIFGQGPKGYFSYRLKASSHEITLFLERGPQEGISFTFDGVIKTLKRKEEMILPADTLAFPRKGSEKMHFGCTKQQDWSLVKRRLLVEEILPIWFHLGKDIPSHPILSVGTSRLLAKCQEMIQGKQSDKIGQAFLDLFQVGFEGILTPRLVDVYHHSYEENPEPVPEEASPLSLLGEGARLIRKLLIDLEGNTLKILPCLPKELHAGRFVDIACSKTLTAHLEWSKKLIRRVVLRPTEDQELALQLQPSVDSFRLRHGRAGRGHTYKAGETLSLQADTLVILDRFQK